MIGCNAFIIGSSWIFRHGVKQPLRRLGAIVAAEGETFEQAYAQAKLAPAAASDGKERITFFVIAVIELPDAFLAGLEQLRSARRALPTAKLVALADPVTDANIAAASEAGIDALLSPKLSSRMLTNSLQLVLYDQKLFPTPGSSLPDQPAPIRPSPEPQVQETAPPAKADEGPDQGELPGAPGDQPKRPLANGARLMSLSTPRPMRVEERLPIALGMAELDTPVWVDGPSSITDASLPGRPSEREWQILRCLARGGSNKLIARELGIAETTVKVHIKSLLRKLAVSNRTQAAIWALNHAKTALTPALLGPASVNGGTNGAIHPADSHTVSCRSV